MNRIATLEARFTKTFAGARVDVELALAPGESAGRVVVLFGPSGCGKTTALRCLAGLERPEAGHVRVVTAREVAGTPTGRAASDGKAPDGARSLTTDVWLDAARGVFLSPQQRGVGFLAQGLALFPHLSVADNVEFGLASLTEMERAVRRNEVLKLLRVDELAARMPASLSGGQAQRVALARTLAPRPRLLLLDEPLSALDAPTREALRRDLRAVLAAAGAPTIVVTHDRNEAIALGDEVVVMANGRVLQSGPVLEVFGRPRTQEVARVVGVDTVLAGHVLELRTGLVVVDVGHVRIEGVSEGVGAGAIEGVIEGSSGNADGAAVDVRAASEVAVCIRAESVTLEVGAHAARSSGRNRIPGKVVAIEPEGALTRVMVDVGFALPALITTQSLEELALKPGDDVIACIKATQVHVVPRA